MFPSDRLRNNILAIIVMFLPLEIDNTEIKAIDLFSFGNRFHRCIFPYR